MKSERKIGFMHSIFGCDTENRKCKDCMHFTRQWRGRRLVRKCDVYGESSSSATDWNASFSACGCFNRKTDEENLYLRNSKYASKNGIVTLKGQVEIKGVCE